MKRQFDKSKGPGVYFPPPILYVLIFVAAIFIQKKIPLSVALFSMTITKVAGILFILISIFFLVKSLRQFFLTKNTVILIKPASSLQTSGIYATTRNPMYAGLSILYLGISCFIGNWWNIILFPLLIIIVQEFVIKKEEKYLQLEFGPEYEEYKAKVRRWI